VKSRCFNSLTGAYSVIPTIILDVHKIKPILKLKAKLVVNIDVSNDVNSFPFNQVTQLTLNALFPISHIVILLSCNFRYENTDSADFPESVIAVGLFDFDECIVGDVYGKCVY
jgi:hypothetical protein